MKNSDFNEPTGSNAGANTTRNSRHTYSPQTHCNTGKGIEAALSNSIASLLNITKNVASR